MSENEFESDVVFYEPWKRIWFVEILILLVARFLGVLFQEIQIIKSKTVIIDDGMLSDGRFKSLEYRSVVAIKEYNMLFYILGILLFILFLGFIYKMLLRDELLKVKQTGLFFKLVYIITAGLFCWRIKVVFASMYEKFNRGYNFYPNWKVTATVWGWPIMIALWLTFAMIYHSIKKTNEN